MPTTIPGRRPESPPSHRRASPPASAGRSPRRATGMARAGAVLALAGACASAVAAPPPENWTRSSPIGRFGTLPTPHTSIVMRNAVVDPSDYGTHGYQVHPGESQGILYTCRAGFVDLDHVRDAADWTAYLRPRFLDALVNDGDMVRFDGEDRDVTFAVRLRRLDPADKARWAGPIATQLARRYAFLLLTWHEVLTWYGYRKVFLFPEQVSAFSYEDTVSHAIGVEVAATAFDASAPWNEAMDAALAFELASLGAVPRDGTWSAFAAVEGRWYDPGSGWPSNAFIRKRALDVGLQGGAVTPWLAAGVPGCAGVTARPLPVDALDTMDGGRFAGFDSARFLPGPERFWPLLFPQGRPQESGRPLESLDPKVHLAPVMEALRRSVVAELGADADRP